MITKICKIYFGDKIQTILFDEESARKLIQEKRRILKDDRWEAKIENIYTEDLGLCGKDFRFVLPDLPVCSFGMRILLKQRLSEDKKCDGTCRSCDYFLTKDDVDQEIINKRFD